MTPTFAAARLTWPHAALADALASHWPGCAVQVHAELDSTNSALMRRLRDGVQTPALLVAEVQTAGRGRLGRAWQGGLGDMLSFSLGVPLAVADWSGLSLAVGLAVAEALHSDIRLKWPNDLWWQGRKLAGILVETAGVGAGTRADAGRGQTALRYAVVGVGLNIVRPQGPGFSTPPAGLQELLPGIDAPSALARIAGPLAHRLRQFEREGFAPLAARFNQRDALAGQAVRLSDGQVGTARGVGPDGALLLHTPTGLQRVTTSEVSVRPLAAMEQNT
ncbi:biotin--[acetyl-CoA-carboxylase] ligase [Ottowia sp.]|uniref:biotin--[acetyl-CoA-carboxylase] ligase n=1 Tax=Ottowia sp. TaxID=1898956 RepID=UPI003A85AEDE